MPKNAEPGIGGRGAYRLTNGRDLHRTRNVGAHEKPSAKILGLKRLEDLTERIRICIKCPLHQYRTKAVPGEGSPNAKVMVIGEAPGKQEDQKGRPFVGNAGRYLEHVLEGTNFDRADLFITNVVKCRPPSNRTPKMEEVETCTSLYLFHQIELLDPKVILLLGSLAVKKMLGIKSVEEARGRFIEHEGRKYLASYHPAVRFYRGDLAQKIKEDFALLQTELKKLEIDIAQHSDEPGKQRKSLIRPQPKRGLF